MTVELHPQFKTKSGEPITIGAGSGTAVKALKRADPTNTELLDGIVDRLTYSINVGYNHLDTAEVYTTHPEIHKAVVKSKAPREKLWITTKYIAASPHVGKTSGSPSKFVKEALEELDTDYIDLLLIHHPFFTTDSAGIELEDAWKELIDAKKAGHVRYIGVSNFAVEHLKRIIAVSEKEGKEYYPVVNQIEYHPYLQNQSEGVVDFSKEHGILIEAYGPLTPLFRITDESGNVIEDHPLKPILPELSKKYKKSEAQVLLRYVLDKGILPITTSSKNERIKEALEIYDFKLSKDDVELIDTEGAKFPYRAFFKGRF
ncbi:aldose reductase [Scheffersomyces coipomensis]|uniref:aldose reductase n=1 Tax=Scheffersomyces coipomensis TaxID=1788519 RepID=UPI00315D302F